MHIVVDGNVYEPNSFCVVNRNIVCAMHRLGYDVRLEAWGQGREKPHRESFIDRDLLDELAAKPKDYDNAITIRQSWPRCEPYYSPAYNWDTIQGKIKIGLLPWESEHLPATWLDNIRTVDVILTISTFSADRIERELCRASVPTPVWGVPLGVDRRLFNPDRPPRALEGARAFRFLHIGVGQPRKGSDLVRQAYLNEFTDADDVTLVVKTGGWDDASAWTEHLEANAPHILVVHDDNIPEAEMGGFYTACHCLVHPARLEGFGMTMLEAMSCGIPVICTEQGAHRVFANASNSILVPCVEEQFAYFQDLVGIAHRVDREALRRAMRTAMLDASWPMVTRTNVHLLLPGLITAQTFSWARTAVQIVDHIERMFGPLDKIS